MSWSKATRRPYIYPLRQVELISENFIIQINIKIRISRIRMSLNKDL